MANHEPTKLSDAEWREIMTIPQVRDGWGLEDNSSVEDFKSVVYGAKFDYITGGPGYFGDLYILQDDSLQPPLLFIRKDGALKPLSQ